jgi:hypothetical protein
MLEKETLDKAEVDAIMEEGRAKVETADHRMHLLDARDGLSIVDRGHNAGVATAREHHQPLASQVDD